MSGNNSGNESRGFGTRIGYILSMAGFCIGIGNLWKFPYMVGANGGGAFLICYLAIALLVGVPLFLIEVQIGRSSQLSGIAGMRKLTGKKGSGWNAIGWVALITVTVIAFYFITIIGWNMGYIVKVATGSLRGLDNAGVTQAFVDFSGSGACIGFTVVTVIMCWILMNTGVKAGVEKICTFAMPLLLIMLVVLAIYSNTLEGSKEGLMWYLTPDFSKITFATIQAASVQVFYSIGVGMCCGIVYGSYIDKKANMVADTASVAVLDTIVATLSGLVIVPALFAFGVEPTAGPSLIFITLPQMFNQMAPGVGTVFGVGFLLCVFLACITSIVGVMEAIQVNLMDITGWSRKKTNTIVTVVVFLGSLLATTSQGTGALSAVRVFGMDFFSLFDCAASAFGLTAGAVLMLAYMLCRWKFENFADEANQGATGKLRIYPWMKAYYKFFLPIALAFIVYSIIASYFF